jgi:hypothetical protein
MYIGDKGLAQVSRVAPLEFKASLFPKNVTRFSPVGDPNFGHSLLKSLGRNPRREVKQVSPGPHCEGGAMVCAIGTDWVTDKNLGEVLSAQGKDSSLASCPFGV